MFEHWIASLLDASAFLPRGRCGPWTDSLKAVSIFSNGSIALAYFMIAIYLAKIARKRSDELDFGWLLVGFTGIFGSCALTHLCDVAVFWWPAYRLFTTVSAVAAILSFAIALYMPRITGMLSDTQCPAVFLDVNSELQSAITLKDEAINDSRATIAALRRQIDHLERMRQTGLWVAEQESALRELKTVLASSTTLEAPK
jgi:hypothetical protein